MMADNCTESAISAQYDRVSTPVLSSISAVSLALNACNIVIFSRRKMVSPTNSILLAIAVSDLCKVSMFLLITAAPMSKTSFASQVLYLFCNVAMFLMHAFALWCGVLLALFRFFYLSFYASPLTKVWFGLARSRLAVCLAFLANFVAVVPYAGVLRVRERRTETTAGAAAANASSRVEDEAPPAVHYEPAMLDEYEFTVRMFNSIAQKIIPCLIMTAFCVCIIRSLRQTEKRRESLANPRAAGAASAASARLQKGGSGGGGGGGGHRERRSRDHRRTTRFLLIIMLLYSMYEIPMALLLILSDPAFQLGTVICFYQAYHGILNTLGLVNNTVNFVLYCFMSKQFRDAFKEVFGLDRIAEKARKSIRRPASMDATAATAAAVDQRDGDIGLGSRDARGESAAAAAVSAAAAAAEEAAKDDAAGKDGSQSDTASNPCLEY